MTKLESDARRGDQVAASICIDLRDALNNRHILSYRECELLSALLLHGNTQAQCAKEFRISQGEVSKRVTALLVRIGRHLEGEG